jgi:CxxC-x17-CxxC domain-containing protein
MSYEDKSLTCSECGTTFVFSAEEQELFASRGYANDPKRCPDCRETRRAERNRNTGYSSPREMFPAICAECGQETEVPFKPREDRPVYCRACYMKMRPERKF